MWDIKAGIMEVQRGGGTQNYLVWRLKLVVLQD